VHLSVYFVWCSSVELTFSDGLLNAGFLLPTEALFNLSVHCRTAFSLSYKANVSLMGQCCSVHLLTVKRPFGQSGVSL
jgi:hypothetical protein